MADFVRNGQPHRPPPRSIPHGAFEVKLEGSVKKGLVYLEV